MPAGPRPGRPDHPGQAGQAVAREVTAELAGRGLAEATAEDLVSAMTAADAEERIRAALKPSEEGSAGLDEVDERAAPAVTAQIPAGGSGSPRGMVRGLSYYTGPIWEVVADGVPGSIASGGRYDHLIEQLGGPDMPGHRRVAGHRADPPAAPGRRRRAAPRRLDVAVTVLGRNSQPASFALAARRPPGRAAGQRLHGLVGEAGPAAQVGQRPGCALDADLRPERGRGRHGHRAGHGPAASRPWCPSGELAGYLAGQAAVART